MTAGPRKASICLACRDKTKKQKKKKGVRKTSGQVFFQAALDTQGRWMFARNPTTDVRSRHATERCRMLTHTLRGEDHCEAANRNWDRVEGDRPPDLQPSCSRHDERMLFDSKPSELTRPICISIASGARGAMELQPATPGDRS